MAEVTRKLGLSTTAIHGGAPPPGPGTGVSSPIVQSVNYAQGPVPRRSPLHPLRNRRLRARQRRLAMLKGRVGARALDGWAQRVRVCPLGPAITSARARIYADAQAVHRRSPLHGIEALS